MCKKNVILKDLPGLDFHVSQNQTWLMVIYELNTSLIFINSRNHFPGWEAFALTEFSHHLGWTTHQKVGAVGWACQAVLPSSQATEVKGLDSTEMLHIYRALHHRQAPQFYRATPGIRFILLIRKEKGVVRKVSIFSRILTGKKWKSAQRAHQMSMRTWLQISGTHEESQPSSHLSVT